MKTSTVAIAAVVACVAAQTVAGKEATYRPVHRPAAELAEVVGQVLPVEIKVVAENLALRGDDEALIQADKFLRRLDRAPRKFQIAVLVAEIAPASAQSAALVELSGPFEEIQAKLEALRKGGALATMKRHELTVGEGARAVLKDVRAENVWIAAEVQVKRALGTSLTAAARGGPRHVSLHVTIQHSRAWSGGADPAFDKVKERLRDSALFMDLINTQVSAAPERAAVILGIARPRSPRLLVVVGVTTSD